MDCTCEQGYPCKTHWARYAVRIQTYLARHQEDPEWQESMRRSGEDIRAGRVLPWRILGPITLFHLPRWLTTLLFWIAPVTYGRRMRLREEK